MATPAKTPGMRAVFQLKDFRKLWLAQFVSIFGDFLALFGVISLITFRLHGTVVQVTYVTIAYMLPLALVGPVAGVFVDRWNVKRVMILSDLIRGALALLLVFVTDLHQIYGIFFCISTVSSFFGPAQSVTVRTIVPVENLLAANAMISQAFYTVRILSPALAGALVAWFSEKVCFYLDSASFIFSAAMIGTLVIVRHVSPEQSAKEQSAKTMKGFTHDFTAGIRFIFTHPSLAFVMIAMMSAMFVLSCFSPLISIYVRDMLKAGSFMFGLISSTIGVGLIVGTQLVNALAKNRPREQIVLLGLFGLAVGVALLGLFQHIPTAAAGTFGMGFAIAFVLVPAMTLMQQETPKQMIGRVSSSFMSMIAVCQLLGMLLSGYLAQWLGILRLFDASAIMLVLLTLAGGMRLRHRNANAIAAET
jgi:MFS family permease